MFRVLKPTSNVPRIPLQMEKYLKVRDVYRKTTALATSSVNRSNSDRSGLRGENYETDETVLQYFSAKSTIVLRLVSRHAVKTSLYDLSGCILTKKSKEKKSFPSAQ